MRFYEWGIQHHYGKPTPLGDLAGDMAFDEYTGPNSHGAIRAHLDRCGAVQGCLDAFEQAWDEYSHATDRRKPTTMPRVGGRHKLPIPIIGNWIDSTSTDGDPSAFLQLDSVDQQVLLDWIGENLWVGEKWNMEHTSYGLKHIFARHTGIYVTNAAFKDAMVLAGFTARWAGQLNHHYRIHPLSPGLEKPNCVGNQRVLPRRRPTRRA
ncbi:hypothetical protein KFR76_00630 [Corynebacterium diphtheriae]|nr:hypothetical protein KFR76_00630 [Corynebacterium diphtheriae]